MTSPIETPVVPPTETPRGRIARLHALAAEGVADGLDVKLSPLGRVRLRMLASRYVSRLSDATVARLSEMTDTAVLTLLQAEMVVALVKDGMLEADPEGT